MEDTLRIVEEVAHVLEEEGVPFALIGAVALSQYGVARSTFDLDLLTIDDGVLSIDWSERVPSAENVDVRRGDALDPVGGLIRLKSSDKQQVDIVVGKWKWMRGALDRSSAVRVGRLSLPAVSRADLVLLKLDAGGPQDAWDVNALLDGDTEGTLIPEVEGHLGELSESARAFWAKILELRK